MDTSTSAKRQRVSAEERLRFVCLFRESGLSQVEFARQHGIKIQTLRQWLYRAEPKQSRKVHFQEVPAAGFLGPSWAAELILEGGATLRLADFAKVELISFLIENLRRRSC